MSASLLSAESTQKPVVCVVGPTASGKSNLGQNIALQIGGEVISADSMQIYKGMNIGTGKMMPAEQKVRHYGLDLIEPGESYSAALFQTYARGLFSQLRGEGIVPILVGGTGLYVRAAIDDYDFPTGEQTENPVREKYAAYLDEQGGDALWNLLYERDAASAQAIHPNNTRRVIRALEMNEQGVSYANQVENLHVLKQAEPAIFIGLRWDVDALRLKIDQRIDRMVEAGLVDEVQTLLALGYREGLTAQQAIGYKEIVAYLEGTCTLDEAINQIKVATHRYAKRQRTWFNKDSRIHWIEATNQTETGVLAEALDIIEREMNQ